MIISNKNVGETPLEFLNRIRLEKPELKDETLSYAGRLDPMAEGQMMIIVGNENNHRDSFMGFDKEYEATFMVGVSTDTGDALGVITKEEDVKFSQEQIIEVVNKISLIKKQKYPWFSGKTVDGIKLFDHFKNGNTDIERPSIDVTVKEAELMSTEDVDVKDNREYILSSVGKVNGEFRQEETINGWEEYFKDKTGNMQIFKVRFLVSSGTFIRAFTEVMPFPATLLKLNRTKICTA
jgi:tRNA pseudouridine(55) synthase